MCTAIKDAHLFGRTLDLAESYGEQVVISPRRYPFFFTHEGKSTNHHAIIGTAHISAGVPLYYDAMNEKGLCIAALRFYPLSCYHEKQDGKHAVASFELIPWLLCNCSDAEEAKRLLGNTSITSDRFSSKLPSAPLHWMVSDEKESFVIESTADGIKIYDNSIGVLTNAPAFPDQLQGIASDILLSRRTDYTDNASIPGALSSTARFQRVLDAKSKTEPTTNEDEAISRFFHILGTVNQPDGVWRTEEMQPMRTVYTSCMDTARQIYFFTTYTCRQIRGVRLKNAHLDLDTLTAFPMAREEWFHYCN